MNIDSQSGTVELDGVKISADALKKRVFVASELGGTFRSVLANQKWESFHRVVQDREGDFAVTVVFFEDRIAEIRLAKLDSTRAWIDWSEHREIKRKVEHDRLLREILGQEAVRCSWGEVSSVFDSKSGGSQIVVRYSGS